MDRQPGFVSPARRQIVARKLEGKIAVVRGGASGIRLATAKRFTAEGARAFRRTLHAGSSIVTPRARLRVTNAKAKGYEQVKFGTVRSNNVDFPKEVVRLA